MNKTVAAQAKTYQHKKWQMRTLKMQTWSHWPTSDQNFTYVNLNPALQPYAGIMIVALSQICLKARLGADYSYSESQRDKFVTRNTDLY